MTHYRRLLVMSLLSFTSMYVLMYAMVNEFANAYLNLNQFYMAGLMTSPMVLIELSLMRAMYPNRKLNLAAVAIDIVAFLGFWTLIRQQAAIADRQFLRSMIPHHAGAILMCRQSPIQDEQIKALCRSIIASQQSEIDQMKAKLAALDR